MPSKAQPGSLLDAVVAAARFQRGVRRARKLRKQRGSVRGGAALPRTDAPLAFAARELRRLAARSAALGDRRRQP